MPDDLDLAEKADAFCQASIGGRIGVAVRLLQATPEIATYSFATAVILGDAARVADELRRDPGLAIRRDARWGWSPLHAACASRWHQLEPGRAEGLHAVVRLLLARGADPVARTVGPGGGSWSPLRCAVASANTGPSNRAVVELLLERGAVPDDHDLYLAGFAHDRHQLLPLLLARVPSLAEVAEQALAAPIANDDVETARLLLDAGALPSRYRDDDGEPASIVAAAIRAGCRPAMLELLVTHGADDRIPAVDRFLAACLRADRSEAQRQLAADPELVPRLGVDQQAALARAAEAGSLDAVALMLDLGFPIESRQDDGATALHAAAYAGSASVVGLLLERGADIEARDTTWNSTPLEWAAVGSGERPSTNPAADWAETVRTLLERGASVEGITLAPDDPKPPGPEVAAILRARLDERSR